MFKSMMLSSKCIKIFYFYLIFIQSFNFLFGELSTQTHNFNLKHLRVQIRDLPNEQDLLKYLKTIEAVTAYNTQTINEVEINLAFGIFLSTVNLRWALKEKGHSIPREIKTRIKNNIINNEEILYYFDKVTNYDDSIIINTEYKQISKLFTNASIWVDRLQKFVDKKQNFYTLNEIKDIYPSWDYYLKYINNVTKWTPSPEVSDMCLASLSISPVDKNYSYSSCSIAGSCYKTLNEGTNFGYALTHRTLLLLMAYFGRGCTIFSPKKDKAMIATYCSMGYTEAEYIAINNYGVVDLMMEIMCLCSLEGDARFMRRSWLNHIMLYYQKPQGCFGIEIARFNAIRLFDNGFTFKSSYPNLSHEDCNGHTTALALGIYSAAIRYIVQEYY